MFSYCEKPEFRWWTEFAKKFHILLTTLVAVRYSDNEPHVVLLISAGAAPGPGGPPQPAQQSKRLQQTQAQVDEVLSASVLVTTASNLILLISACWFGRASSKGAMSVPLGMWFSDVWKKDKRKSRGVDTGCSSRLLRPWIHIHMVGGLALW